MRLHWQALVTASVLCAAAAHGAAPEGRPDLATAKPIVACKLQALAAKPVANEEISGVLFYTGRPVEDRLASYERTALGDWPMPANSERTDPWLRLMLLSPKRPVVLDVALFIDGKSFRDKRDTWIDELVTTPKPAESPQASKDAAATQGNNKPDSDGTKPAAEASEGAAPMKGEAEAREKEKDAKADDVPTTGAKGRQAPTMRERLADYLTLNQSKVDREEIRWLIAAWGAGPGVVLLEPGLSWQRSALAPLETFLDRNADGTFSKEEIAQCDAMFQRADVDVDDVVELSEIRRTINRASFTSSVGGYPLVVILDANTDMPKIEMTMAKVYGTQSGAAPATSNLQTRPADFTLQVNLSTTDKGATGLSIVSIGPDFSKQKDAASATADVVTLDLGGDYVELSAAQRPARQETDSAATQVAIGAALDGNPLLRLLDRNNDGRLTRRERQELSDLFAALDRSHDGDVSGAEVPVPIRLGFTLGPHVHELLASPTAAARETTPGNASPAAPSWFTSMDKNNDSDLSRGEFLGTTEQFKQLDTSGDGMLSVAEALKFSAAK